MRPPAELDVFRIPHCRMKHLMNEVITKLTDTDFSNAVHLRALLGFVDNHFEIFQSHEQIENTHILKSLLERMPRAQMKSLESEIHEHHRLAKMRSFIGDLKLRVVEDDSKVVECGMTLKAAIQQFAGDFFPHMEEEESVVQPLLMEYFTKDELRALKSTILRLHSLPNNSPSQEELLVEEWNKSVSFSCNQVDYHTDLPDEVWLKIYGYLNPRDLSRCARVCKVWLGMSRDMSLWHSIWPTQWAKGKWSFEPPEDEEEHDDTVDRAICCRRSDGFMGWEDEDEWKNDEFDVEHWVLTRIVKHLLPSVGTAVKRLGLGHSKVLTNALMTQIFRLCPNLLYLDVSYTRVSDKAFSSVSSPHPFCLTYLDLSGCSSITDQALKHLAIAFQRRSVSPCGDCDCESRRSNRRETTRRRPLLVSLSLSGCYQITDSGLSVLAGSGGLLNTTHLDLSGCMNVSGVGLTNAINTCTRLNHEKLFYCDNILDGPYPETASGCRNVGSSRRVCCRIDY